jgi:hypothetical protein
LNVEFKEINVVDRRRNNKNCLSDNADAKRKAEYIIRVKEQQKKQLTAKEHVDILLRLKIRVLLFSSVDIAAVGATLSSPHLDFAILNIL